jgi:hypothetical protein
MSGQIPVLDDRRKNAYRIAKDFRLPSMSVVGRITTTRYFRNEHHELPDNLVSGNDQVMSFSQCDACHTGVSEGVSNEHRVRIPDYGAWDD